MAGREGKRIFVLFLCEHIVRGAELLDGGVVEPCAFLHLRSDEQALALGLGQLRLDVPPAADRQGIRRDVAAVQAEHTGDGIPEGRLTVPATAVGDDQGFHVDLANDGESADHLDVIDQLLVMAKDQV